MKKSLLAVLLAVALVLPVVPAFCEEGVANETSKQEVVAPVAESVSEENKAEVKN